MSVRRRKLFFHLPELTPLPVPGWVGWVGQALRRRHSLAKCAVFALDQTFSRRTGCPTGDIPLGAKVLAARCVKSEHHAVHSGCFLAEVIYLS